nr:Type I secretion system membrane fusion protein PrsE [Cupriavidus sp.]
MHAAIKRGVWILFFLFMGFVLWAVLVPLDAAVPSQGMVSVDGRRKVVQHPRGGVVSNVLIREGDTVASGDLLLRLDDSLERANRSQVLSQLLVAELRAEALQEVLPDLRALTNDGFYPRNRLVEQERQLQEALALRQGLVDQLASVERELSRTEIRAPASGRIMGLSVTTEGGVIIAGAKLMDIVPIESRITIEAQVRPHLIDKVLPGASAQVRFSALESTRTPVIEGTIEWVSPDRFHTPEDSRNPEGYYLAKVLVEPSESEKLNGLKVIPGMPADVLIKTGERTFLQYLMKPFSDRLAHAVKEQ